MAARPRAEERDEDDLYAGLNFDLDSQPAAAPGAVEALGLDYGLGTLPTGPPMAATGGLRALRG
jgi:hypothetical protein